MKIVDDRFWRKVEKLYAGCWEWRGSINSRGYGKVHRRKIKSIPIIASRYAWYLKHGKFSSLETCHKCDNPSCVNPEHLFEGTHKQNMMDCSRKGRLGNEDRSGEKNNNAKLNKKKIEEIRHLIKEGLNNKQIALKYEVTHSMISRIRRKKLELTESSSIW